LFLNSIIYDFFPDVTAPIFQEPEAAKQESEATIPEVEPTVQEAEPTIQEAGQEGHKAGNSFISLATSKDTSVFWCFIFTFQIELNL
jgi:hypothetical protein